jgi:hypothetical protein
MQQSIRVGGFANNGILPFTIQQTFGAVVSKNTNFVGIAC